MSNEWTTTPPTVSGWYWVTDGNIVWPAKFNPAAAGGWGNDDTWEDFYHVVTHWLGPLPVPAPPIDPNAV